MLWKSVLQSWKANKSMRECSFWQGKKVVVTGGGRRIGAALVRGFAAQGASIVIHYHKGKEEAAALLEEIGGTAKGHSLVCCDLSRPLDIPFWENILVGCSLLINNASLYFRKGMEEEQEEEREMELSVNYRTPLALMEIFRKVCAGEDASIINMLDQGIAHADPNAFTYALSKKMLAEATKSCALSFAPAIRVNGIAPGPMIPPPDLPFSKMEKTLPRIPLKRAVKVEDIVKGALFLGEASSATGTILTLDGGLSLQGV